ncbi:hypothetical protein APHAL10511_000560 [Amanita phalloides]|nr:hypothetical protein APHAL10511_000560 [Amanita phalloides]
MPISHHSHSGQFCKHAKGSLEQVVLAAINRQFLIYGLSEHVPRYRQVDLYPEEVDCPLNTLADQFHTFVEEAHRLKTLYAPRIRLLVGLETEHITALDLDRLADTLQTYGDRIQYLVGSVHHVNEIPIDFDVETYKRAVVSAADNESDPPSLEGFLVAYLDAQYDLLQRFHPEIIGHIDLCRLYTPDLRFADYSRALERLRRNVRYAVAYGALFEVNAAAFKKGWKTAYPGPDVLDMIRKEGGYFTLSDDSHGPQTVGLNYGLIQEYLLSAGVDELWYLEESDVPNAGGRKTRPVRLPGEWWTNSFWHV